MSVRIALDAMGGDRAPAAPVEGAVRALRTYDDVEVVLVGAVDAIEVEVERLAVTPEEDGRLYRVLASHVATMGEDPVRAVRTNPGNSARVCAELLRAGDVRGVVNMGSTGAAVAAAQLYCGRLDGVRRPGIAVPFPRPGGVTLLIDCGANSEGRAEDLHQFAIMASLYARGALGIDRPRVGILSIGEEEHKGNELVHETWALFRARGVPNLVGNVEPRELFQDRADVVVCDGFSGNLVLKAVEGMAEFLLGSLAGAVDDPPERARLIGHLAGDVDYAEYGGAPLLGIRGAYVIGHGRSDARAFLNGIRVARAFISNHVGDQVIEELHRAGAGAAGGGGA